MAMHEHSSSNCVDTFRYIERMSAELAEMAARNGEDLLSYLLNVSREEALNAVTRHERGEASTNQKA